MLFKIAKDKVGVPVPVIRSCKISGVAQVVDQLTKRVVLLNRDTMQLIAARNVNADNTWEMFAPDQGAGKHIILGLDEGGNFNLNGFDRASLGPHTFEVDEEAYDAITIGATCGYVSEQHTVEFDDLGAIKLPGTLERSAPLSGIYFHETIFGGFGGFKDAEGDPLPVGIGTDYPEIKEGTILEIGGVEFRITQIQGDMVWLSRPLGVVKADVLGDDSCVFCFTNTLSLATSSNHVITDEAPFLAGQAGFIFPGYGKVSNFIPTAENTKIICFEYWTVDMGTQTVSLLLVHNSLEICLYNSSESIQCYVGNGAAWTDNAYSTGGVGHHFVLVRILAGSTEVYVDNMTTPKLTRAAVTFSGAPLAFGGANGHNLSNAAYGQQIKKIRVFNRDMDATARAALYADNNVNTPAPVQVSGVIKAEESSGNIIPVVEQASFRHDVEMGNTSFLEGGYPADFKTAWKVYVNKVNPTAANFSGRVVRVPEDGLINTVIPKLVDGDIVVLAPGTYTYAISTNDKYFHVYGDTQEGGAGVILNSTARGVYLTHTVPDSTGLTGRLTERPITFQNITFAQGSANSSVVVRSESDTPLITVDFINCSFTNSLGPNIELFSATINNCYLRFFNCYFSKNASYPHFKDVKVNTDAYFSRIELHKCLLNTALAITGGGIVDYQDYVTVATEGYGFWQGPNRVGRIAESVTPIFYLISGETITEDALNLRIGIDLSVHPEIFDEVSSADEISLIFETGAYLDFEVESFDVATKKGLIWATLPYVSATDITHFAILYPYSLSANSDPEGSVAKAVWDDYLFVYHMTEDPVGTDAVVDSAGENHGTPSGMALGDRSFAPLSSYEYTFDGAKSINSGNLCPEGLVEGTIEVVFKTTQTDGHILSQDADGWNDRDVNLSIGDPTGVVSTVSDGYLNFEVQGPGVGEVKNITSTVAVNDGQYHYAGITWYRDNWGLVLDDEIEVAPLDYKLWPGAGNVMLGTDGASFFNGSIGELLISDKFKSAEYHRLINASIDNSLFDFSLSVINNYFISKSVVFDIADNWGFANYVGGRQIDFYYLGSKLSLTAGVDFVAYATSIFSATTHKPDFIFDTTTSYIGGQNYNCWVSYPPNIANQRLIIVFNSLIQFDDIKINNYHTSGTYTNIGMKNVKVYISDNAITSTVYGEVIPNSELIFDGQIPQHINSDVVDANDLDIIDFSESEIELSFTADKSLQNVPLKFDLEATGLDAGDIVGFLASPANIIAASTTDVSLKIEKLDWVAGVTAPLWVLIDEVAEGTNSITLTVGAGANSDNGVVGSAVGQEVFQDFKAAYHLCQDPAVAIIDSTGNNPNATPVNMDASNLVNGALVFNGTDEALNLGVLFDSVQDSGQIHMSIKTSQASAPLLMQGTEGLQLTATGELKADASNTMEGTTIANDNTWKVLTVAHDIYKRDMFVSGNDEIPYAIFGSTGTADVIIAGNYLGASFAGSIPEIRFNKEAEYQGNLVLQGKLWGQSLMDTPNDPQIIPVISFDQGNTYKIWDESGWRAIVSNDDAVHGDTGDTDWHYVDSDATWAKPSENVFNDALVAAVQYPENRNHGETLSGLDSSQWTSAGGLNAQGDFTLAFCFNSPITGITPVIENVSLDGMLLPGPSYDLEPFTDIITGSKLEWCQKVMGSDYDYSQVEVYAHITGGAWQLCTRNEAIPGISEGMDTTGLTLDFKIKAPVGFPAGSVINLFPKIF